MKEIRAKIWGQKEGPPSAESGELGSSDEKTMRWELEFGEVFEDDIDEGQKVRESNVVLVKTLRTVLGRLDELTKLDGRLEKIESLIENQRENAVRSTGKATVKEVTESEA